MFEKLLASLPYNPSLVHQLGFYAKRMRSEASIRRTGMVFIVLAFAVQFYAVVSPPQPTVADSVNDLINGGITYREQAVSACTNNVRHYADIMHAYGITCDEIANAPTQGLNSRDYNSQLYSAGWIDYKNKAGETAQTLPNAGTIYWRYLWSWDTGSSSNYTALRVTSGETGKTFFILYSCGNLVSVGLPSPITPHLNIGKDTIPGNSFPAAGSNVHVGDTIGYRMYFSDWYKGQPVADAHWATVTDALPADTSFVWLGSGGADNGGVFHSQPASPFLGQPTAQNGYAEWVYNDMHTGSNPYYVDLRVKVTAMPPGNHQICNVAFIRSVEYPPVESNQVCHTVVAQSAPVTPTPTPTPTTQPTPPVTPTPPSPVVPVPVTTSVCQYNSTLSSSSPECKPCDKSISSLDTLACITPSKKATDTTQGWTTTGDGQTAKAGDTIVYTIMATNNGKSTQKQFQMQEGLSDVLDYADVVSLDGGTMDNYKNVVWPVQDIAAGASLSHTITVKVKDPIPQTPPDPGDPGHFDHNMMNSYGNTINIKLPGSVLTTVETTSTTLPNTGPGTSIMIAGAIVIIAGYFFARARLLTDESAIVIQENAVGGM